MNLCIVPKCENTNYHARGLCKKHYKQREYYRNIQKHKIRAKKWREKTRTEESLAYKRKDSKEFKRRLTRCRNRATKINKEFDLTLEFYSDLMKLGCYYCKTDLIDVSGFCLDRIDNNLGYLKTNVLPCCKQCNYLRGNSFTVEETKIAITAILEYRKNNVRD